MEDVEKLIDVSDYLEARCAERESADVAMAKRHQELFRRNDEAMQRARHLTHPDPPAEDKTDDLRTEEEAA
jgi:hypothetical protein